MQEPSRPMGKDDDSFVLCHLPVPNSELVGAEVREDEFEQEEGKFESVPSIGMEFLVCLV